MSSGCDTTFQCDSADDMTEIMLTPIHPHTHMRPHTHTHTRTHTHRHTILCPPHISIQVRLSISAVLYGIIACGIAFAVRFLGSHVLEVMNSLSHEPHAPKSFAFYN